MAMRPQILLQRKAQHMHKMTDPSHILKMSIFRLRTGHNRLRNHLFHKLKIGDTDQCRCRTESQTTEHLLHFC